MNLTMKLQGVERLAESPTLDHEGSKLVSCIPSRQSNWV